MNRCIVKISEQGAHFVHNGQTWMYRNNLVSDIEEFENGCICDVETEAGEYLGTGILSKNSHVTVRILTKERVEEFDHAFFLKRMQQAYDFRKTVEPDNMDNVRLID